MRELVFNEAVSSLTGLPIDDCGCDESPLIPPVLNFSNQGSGQAAGSQYDLDAPLVCPTLNFQPGDHSFDRSGISPVVRGGSSSADSQYGLSAPPRAPFNDGYEERQDANNRENQRRLGLLDEGEPLVPPSTTAAIIADSRQRTQQAARASFAGR